MARIASGPPTGIEREFVPAAYGNRNAPTADQVVVLLRDLTEGDKRRCRGKLKTTPLLDASGVRALGDKGEPASTATAESAGEWQREMLRLGVVSVSGYQRRGSGGTVIPIATAQDFLEHGEDDFISEVFAELLRAEAMTEGQKKTSAPSPGSSSETPGPSPGTAPSAPGSDAERAAGTGGNATRR